MKRRLSRIWFATLEVKQKPGAVLGDFDGTFVSGIATARTSDEAEVLLTTALEHEGYQVVAVYNLEDLRAKSEREGVSSEIRRMARKLMKMRTPQFEQFAGWPQDDWERRNGGQFGRYLDDAGN